MFAFGIYTWINGVESSIRWLGEKYMYSVLNMGETSSTERISPNEYIYIYIDILYIVTLRIINVYVLLPRNPLVVTLPVCVCVCVSGQYLVFYF